MLSGSHLSALKITNKCLCQGFLFKENMTAGVSERVCTVQHFGPDLNPSEITEYE